MRIIRTPLQIREMFRSCREGGFLSQRIEVIDLLDSVSIHANLDTAGMIDGFSLEECWEQGN